MKRVLILVEGQTEEAFVQSVLAPGLLAHGVSPSPTVVSTKRVTSGGSFKGGVTSYQRVAVQLRRLLSDTGVRLVSTMLDLYRLPGDFPGRRSCPAGSGKRKAEHLERCFANDIGDQRFRPYLSVHEFEALLFAGLESCGQIFRSGRAIETLRAQRARFPTPEDVNDGKETSPSRRIAQAFPRYQKVRHGPIATELIGLPRLRKECPHFDAWVRDLEQVGATPPHSSNG
jgi:hypothetical protein